MKTLLNKDIKNLICEALKDYAKGEEYVYSKTNVGKVIKGINPEFHNSIKYNNYFGQVVRRYRFNIIQENSWNCIKMTKELKEEIENKVKDILNNNNIKYQDCKLTSYYPHISSRPQYDPWIRCLEIYFLENMA